MNPRKRQRIPVVRFEPPKPRTRTATTIPIINEPMQVLVYGGKS